MSSPPPPLPNGQEEDGASDRDLCLSQLTEERSNAASAELTSGDFIKTPEEIKQEELLRRAAENKKNTDTASEEPVSTSTAVFANHVEDNDQRQKDELALSHALSQRYHAAKQSRARAELGANYVDFDDDSFKQGQFANDPLFIAAGIIEDDPLPNPASDVRTSSESNSGNGKMEYCDNQTGQPMAKHRVPPGSVTPGAYSGAPGADYEALEPLQLDLLGSASSNPLELLQEEKEEMVAVLPRVDGSNLGPSGTGPEPDIPQETRAESSDEESAIPTAHVEWVSGPLTHNPDGTAADAAIERKKKMMLIRVGMLLLVLVMILAIIAIPLAVRGGGQEDGTSLENTTIDNSTEGEISDPVPTQSPTVEVDQVEQDDGVLLPNAANSTLELIALDQSSSQYQAFTWLTLDPNLRRYKSWRREQRFALATFFYEFGGPQFWTWLNYEIDECEWGESFSSKQVHCNTDGHVKRITMRKSDTIMDFIGSIPPELSLLGQLEEVDLSGNHQHKPILSLLPSSLSPESFPSLKVIGCTNCSLRLSIPAELCDWTQLHTLRLGTNWLSAIPVEIQQMTQLQELILNRNSLTGTIPVELTQLDQLQSLSLETNRMFGMVPSEIGLMTSLTRLGLSENRKMTGSLPSELGLMTALAFLNMSTTAISGSIPSELGLLTSLTELALHDSNLSGMVPSSLCSNPDLLQILVDCDSVDCTCSQCKCMTL
ncbi:Leucine Rich Repeat [Seminavis robusta]|uniref:Leucine Rich Repeat n=1 Tax=Seminavis robusta TaxID=568900 RepID=A0A9N8DWJ9_9STRA|nr:Leucine Rich Repeat [Seminavis robusta]|eukprot:Sro430_g141290.1 Leucine Rich Repeat (715) ;mRNA; r:26755-28899